MSLNSYKFSFYCYIDFRLITICISWTSTRICQFLRHRPPSVSEYSPLSGLDPTIHAEVSLDVFFCLAGLKSCPPHLMAVACITKFALNNHLSACIEGCWEGDELSRWLNKIVYFEGQRTHYGNSVIVYFNSHHPNRVRCKISWFPNSCMFFTSVTVDSINSSFFSNLHVFIWSHYGWEWGLVISVLHCLYFSSVITTNGYFVKWSLNAYVLAK